MGAQGRYALRAALVGLATAAGSLQMALPGIDGDDIWRAVLAGVIASLAYAGVGFAVPQVEPKVGNKLSNV